MRPFTISIPKPLLPIGDVPILEVVLYQLAASGFDRVAITLGHMPHLFMATIGDGSRFGLRMSFIREDTPLGTAGSLKLISDLEDVFLVMNGDLLTTLDYRELMAEHGRRRAAATIALARREVRIDYGVVETDAEGFLERYVEKPAIGYEVSMGINVLARECVSLIPGDRKFDMPELLVAVRDSGRAVACFRPSCYWQDIGRMDDYEQASADFKADPDRFLRKAPKPL